MHLWAPSTSATELEGSFPIVETPKRTVQLAFLNDGHVIITAETA
jgi:hypothetical protein